MRHSSWNRWRHEGIFLTSTPLAKASMQMTHSGVLNSSISFVLRYLIFGISLLYRSTNELCMTRRMASRSSRRFYPLEFWPCRARISAIIRFLAAVSASMLRPFASTISSSPSPPFTRWFLYLHRNLSITVQQAMQRQQRRIIINKRVSYCRPLDSSAE